MRHGIRTAALIASATALGFTAIAYGGSAKQAKEPSIYYKSQAAADAALAQFDKDNPSCQLWTNWQKMCSRTGENGGTRCTTDPNVPVKPSSAFCIEPLSEIKSQPLEQRDSSQKSSQRFDRVREHKRPFNGRNLAARRHPYCRVWGEEHTGKFICSEDPVDSELASCASLARQKFKASNTLYCAAEAEEKISSCKHPRGLRGNRTFVERPSYPYTKADDEVKEILAIVERKDALLSIYCDR